LQISPCLRVKAQIFLFFVIVSVQTHLAPFRFQAILVKKRSEFELECSLTKSSNLIKGQKRIRLEVENSQATENNKELKTKQDLDS
jgi:hypothetical protein